MNADFSEAIIKWNESHARDYKWAYSNFGFALIGNALGIVSSKSLKDFTISVERDDISVLCELLTFEGQSVMFESRTANWIKMNRLIKSNNPSPFPALTQIELYGTEDWKENI